jgi:hypothetical protein
MLDGLWSVQYYGPQGSGTTVVVLTDGHVVGGDNGFVYLGSYEAKDGAFRAKVSVRNFDASVPNVIGVVGDFNLIIDGTIEGGNVSGTAHLADIPSAKMVVRLTKRADLPF